MIALNEEPEDLQDQIEYARFAVEHNQEVINLIDLKSGLILGIVGIVISLIFTIDKQRINPLAFCSIIVGGSLFIISGILAFLVIFPRYGNGSQTKMFFKSIVNEEREKFANSFENLTCQEILKDYTNDLYSLAQIITEKLRFFKWSLILLMLSLSILLISEFLILIL